MRFLLLLLMLNSLPVGAVPAAEIASGGFAHLEKTALGARAFGGFSHAGKRVFGGKFASVGIVYMQHRYMDPVTGGFLSEDPVRGSVSSPYSMQGFTYAGGNPLVNVDPDGRAINLPAAGIGAAIGGVVGCIGGLFDDDIGCLTGGAIGAGTGALAGLTFGVSLYATGAAGIGGAAVGGTTGSIAVASTTAGAVGAGVGSYSTLRAKGAAHEAAVAYAGLAATGGAVTGVIAAAAAPAFSGIATQQLVQRGVSVGTAEVLGSAVGTGAGVALGDVAAQGVEHFGVEAGGGNGAGYSLGRTAFAGALGFGIGAGAGAVSSFNKYLSSAVDDGLNSAFASREFTPFLTGRGVNPNASGTSPRGEMANIGIMTFRGISGIAKADATVKAVFENGMQPRGGPGASQSLDNLLDSINIGSAKSGWIQTSISPDVSLGFATNGGTRGGVLFEVIPSSRAVIANQSKIGPRVAYPEQYIVGEPGGVVRTQVVRAHYVDKRGSIIKTVENQ